MRNTSEKHVRSQRLPVALVVLTYNEESNLRQCLESVKDWVEDIFVVDCYSSDKTLDIAREYTERIYTRAFTTQADQFNWALDNLPISSDWILKLDADEYMTQELWAEIGNKLLHIKAHVNGFYINRRFYFLGRWIRYGGHYPVWLLRLWRQGKGRSEDREMDEHIVISEGEARHLKHDFIHDDRKGLSWWIEKHNRYSAREARERMKERSKINPLAGGQESMGVRSDFFGSQVERKRWFKENIYLRMPLFIRPIFLFVYRYIFLLGFLDGVPGLIFHFLQAFWHQFVVDAKIYEMGLRKYENVRKYERDIFC